MTKVLTTDICYVNIDFVAQPGDNSTKTLLQRNAGRSHQQKDGMGEHKS